MDRLQRITATLAPLSMALWLGGCVCAEKLALIKGGVEFSLSMQYGPGTSELRAAGCKGVLVLTPEAFRRFGEALPHAEEMEDVGEQEDLRFSGVWCIRSDNRSALDCSEVARVYAGSEGVTAERISTTVRDQDQDEALCEGWYDAEGHRIEEVNLENLKAVAPE